METKSFAALGHETRLAIFRMLLEAGRKGLSPSDIGTQLAVAPSTLSPHLARLERAGLIGHARQQRNLIYSINIEGTRALIHFLVDDCCGGAPELCGFKT